MTVSPCKRTLRMRVHALSLRTKLLVSYLALSTICLVPFALISSARASLLSERSTLYSAQQAVEQAADSIEFRMKSLRQANYTFAYGEETVHIFSKDPAEDSLGEQLHDRDTLESMLRRIRLAYPHTVTAVHLYMNDQFIYVSPNSDTFWSFNNLRSTEWFRAMQAARRFSYYIPPAWNASPDSVSVAHLISNPHNYAESIGAVVIDTPRAALEDILKKCAVTERSYCYLVNEAGVLVAASDERRTEMMPEAAAAALQNGGVWRTAQRRVSVRAIDECSWALVQVVPEADLSEVRYAQVQAFVLCALAVLTVSCVLAVLMANGITRRINVLSGRMKAFRYEHSRLLPVPADGGDDIDRLMDSYNGLVGAVRTLSAENVRKGRQLNETELAMLYTQINPHFLFNTLDMIRYLADHNQNDKISAAMIALAQFYRKSLNGGRRMSTVRGELDHVRAYMQIQRLRFGDDVALRVDVPEALMNCPLPAVTLQPIVENALLHGILGRADKSGEIRITGEASGGEARITVRDDGCGMTAAQVAALFDESRAGGVGLRNTDTRLRMQFGAGCGLSVQSEEGEYTAVTVHLPPPRPDSEPPEQV